MVLERSTKQQHSRYDVFRVFSLSLKWLGPPNDTAICWAISAQCTVYPAITESYLPGSAIEHSQLIHDTLNCPSNGISDSVFVQFTHKLSITIFTKCMHCIIYNNTKVSMCQKMLPATPNGRLITLHIFTQQCHKFPTGYNGSPYIDP